jgi:ribosomal protein L37E
MDYKEKYLKYKVKYLNLKKSFGGMDNDKKQSSNDNCQICSIEFNNDTNNCTNPKAFKKVLDDGKMVCLACCEALDFMEDTKPSAPSQTTQTPQPKKKLVEIKSNIKCRYCGNNYPTTQNVCDKCGLVNPLFKKPSKKKKKKKKKRK